MTTTRIRAALRLIHPDDITPMGKRVLEKVLDDIDQQAGSTHPLRAAQTSDSRTRSDE